MFTLKPTSAVAGIALALLASTSAYAVDGQAFADRMIQVFSGANAQVAFGEARTAGENVTLTQMVVTSGGENIELGDVTFENVTGTDEAGWNVERVPFPAYTKTTDATTVTIGESVIEGLQIKGTGAAAGSMVSELYFDNASLGAVAVQESGKTAFTLNDAAITNSETDGGGIDTEFNLGNFFADFTVGGEEGLEVVRELGYPQVNGSISGSASWTPSNGELVLDGFNIAVDKAGELSLAYAINGYTPAFAQSLAQVQTQMAAGGDSSATGMALLGLASQLSLASAEISYTDAALAGKLLDYYAKQNNQSRDDLVSSLVATLPPVLGYLQNPAFEAEVTSAVEAFLRDPKSLTISIDPDAPIAATQIIGAAMGAPQTLPSVLSLSVTSNEQP